MAYATDLTGVLAELAVVGLDASSFPDTDDKLLTLQTGANRSVRMMVQAAGVDPDGLTTDDTAFAAYLEDLLTVEAAHRSGQFQMTRDQVIGLSQRIATARVDLKPALQMGASTRLAASNQIRIGSMVSVEDVLYPETD